MRLDFHDGKIIQIFKRMILKIKFILMLLDCQFTPYLSGFFLFLCATATIKLHRRDARVVEWDGLENRCTVNGTGGSNPSLSAK